MTELVERKKVGIWLRVSTQMQVTETDSLEHHQARAEAYCQAKDWEVVETYRFEAVSGKIVLNHPTAQQMIADVKSGKINTLIFSSLSRLARNTRQLLQISETFQKHNASLVSLKESIDTDSPAGRLFFTVLSALATFESEEVSERIKASIETRAKLGKPLGGAAPFGYVWKDKKMELEPKESKIRKEIFNIFLENKRFKTTARLLNEKGYRTRNGSKFSDASVKRLLTDTIAKGLKRTNYSKQTDDGNWEVRPESEWIFQTAPKIVSEKIFDKVNAIIISQQASKKKPTRLPVHPFSGLVFCGCKEGSEKLKMRVYSSTKEKYTCPDCRRKIPKTDLENIYKEQLKNFILSPKKLSAYLSKADESIKEKEVQLTILKDEQITVDRESKKLFELFTKEQITAESFGRNNREYDERFNQLEKSIPQIQAEIDILKSQILDDSQVSFDSQSLYEKWDSFDNKQKIEVIKSLTESIVIFGNEVEIKLHFIPSVLNKQRQQGNESTKIHRRN